MNASPGSEPERDRVYRYLRDAIVDGGMAPNARLVEAQIAMRTGVSRTPVREALLQLEREGFAFSERHRGFRVAALDERTAREIFPMLGALQGLAVVETGALVASLAQPLRSANDRLRRARKKTHDALAADAEFHRILISLCPNARLLSLIETLHQQLARYEHAYMSDASLIDMSLAQHDDIIAGVANGDVAAAERAARANYASGLVAVIAKVRAGRSAG